MADKAGQEPCLQLQGSRWPGFQAASALGGSRCGDAFCQEGPLSSPSFKPLEKGREQEPPFLAEDPVRPSGLPQPLLICRGRKENSPCPPQTPPQLRAAQDTAGISPCE